MKNLLTAQLDSFAKDLHKRQLFGSELLVLQAASRIKTLMKGAKRVCRWKEGQYMGGPAIRTDCGQVYTIDTENPESVFAYCPQCGGKLEYRWK